VDDRELRGRIVVELVRRGWRPPRLDSHAAERLIDHLETAHHHNRQLVLSPTELRTLELFANGGQEGVVAERLKVSRETVRQRMKSVRRKMGVGTAAHAVALAVHRDWIQVDDEEDR